MKTTNITNKSSSVSKETIRKELIEYILDNEVYTQNQIIRNFPKYNFNQSTLQRLIIEIGFTKNSNGIYAETKESLIGRNKKIFATICNNEHITINSPLVYALSGSVLSNLETKDGISDNSDSLGEPSLSISKKKSGKTMYCIPIKTPAGSETYLVSVISNIIDDFKYFGITKGFRCIFILTYSPERAKKIRTRLWNAKNAK